MGPARIPVYSSGAATFYYAMSYDFRPRYYISDWLHLRARFVVEQELANADSTTYLYEPMASDTLFDIQFTDVLDPVMDWFDLNAFLRFTFPSSKASQARTLVLSGTAGFNIGLGAIYSGGQAFRHAGTTSVAYVDGHVAAVHAPRRGELATPELLETFLGYPDNGFLSDDNAAYDPR